MDRAISWADLLSTKTEFHECPACGEKVYDREAMRKIEAHYPAFSKTSTSSGANIR